MIDPFPLLCDNVVTHLQSVSYSIGQVTIARTWRHFLSLKEIRTDVRVSVAPWDLSRAWRNRGQAWLDDMAISVVVQKAVQWDNIPEMDEMSALSFEVLNALTTMPTATLGSAPDLMQAVLGTSPTAEPFVVPEDATELGLFTSRLAAMFVVQEV